MIEGDRYVVTAARRDAFRRDGWVHLPGVVTEEELCGLEREFERFLAREIEVPGKDFCDMAGTYDRPIEEWAVVNVMLPGRYHPPWRANVFERRVASIAAQLHGDDMRLDYDQLLAKPPGREDGVFHWHQDQAYWPRTADPRTATAWLAVDPSTRENGCMRFVSGSHREASLRPHRPLHGDRETSHTLVADVDESRDVVTYAELARGDATVHDERVLHGSGPNRSSGWRRACVVAFRSAATVARERELGFTHSHEDAPEVKDRVGE